MQTPDVTKAQLVAIAKVVIALAVSLGAPISQHAQAEVITVVGVLATALVVADALIRNGRAKVAVKKIEQEIDAAYRAMQEAQSAQSLAKRVTALEAAAAERGSA